MLSDIHNGLSSDCPKFAPTCKWMCCEKIGCSDHVGGGLYIYPHELEGRSDIDHLKIRMNYPDGGKIVVCKAENLQTCDHKYKPVDCKLFPVFPKFKESDLLIYKYALVLKGFTCPYDEDATLNHVNSLLPLLFRISLDKTLVDFYNKRQLVGYVHLFNLKQWKSKFKSTERYAGANC